MCTRVLIIAQVAGAIEILSGTGIVTCTRLGCDRADIGRIGIIYTQQNMIRNIRSGMYFQVAGDVIINYG